MWNLLLILFLFVRKNGLIRCSFENLFGLNEMPINVLGSTSGNTENKLDASFFVQKAYLRTNYIESIIDEDIDMKNLESKIYLILLIISMV